MLRLSALAKREGVTYSVVYSWIKQHELPFLDFGGRMYVEESEFDDWKQSKHTVIERKPKEGIALPAPVKKAWLAKKLKPVY